MGNSESSNPIRNMDKRTARREYRDDFMNSIQLYRNKALLTRKAHQQDIHSNIHNNEWLDGSIKVCVRKRPIFKHETDAYEFDVITCDNTEHHVIIHDARMHADMKRQILNHHEFQFDRVFNEKTTNEQIYLNTVEPLLQIACDGGYSTCMVYGQTGSGKTFTMSSIYEYASNDIFRTLDSIVDRFAIDLPTISMSFVEIAGDLCHDLLNRFEPVQLLTGNDGSVHAYPVVEPVVASASQLLGMIHHGMNVRTTAATGVHDASSRSHAILRIYIQRKDLRSDKKGDIIEGTLSLVDLAGSEHKIDSMYHGKERRKETGNINASLMALKECIRSRAAGKALSHQYRRSKLTLALKSSFSSPIAKTIVIATVSPASKDTEHSLNTLRHACVMNGQQADQNNESQQEDRETRFITGGTVVTQVIGEVNLTDIARRNAKTKRTGGTMDVLRTNNGNNVVDSKAARIANQEIEITEKDRLRMRKAAEKASISQMSSECRELLKISRNLLRNNEIQTYRLQRRQNISSSDEIEEEDFDFHSSLNKSNKIITHFDNPDDLNSIEDQIEAVCYDDNYLHNEDVEDNIPEIPSPSSNRVTVGQLISSSPKINMNHIKPAVTNQAQEVAVALEYIPINSSSIDKRKVDFKKIYDSIFSVAGNNVPHHILCMQLESILSLHGYASDEIETLLLEELQRNENTKYTAVVEAAAAAEGSHRSRININNVDKKKIEVEGRNDHQMPVRRNMKSSMKEIPQQSNTKINVSEKTEKQKKSDALIDQEKRRQEGLKEAARLLEEQAAIRRKRQEAAKLLRQEQDMKRKQLSMQMKSSSSRSSSAGVMSDNKSTPTSSSADNNGNSSTNIQYYENEIEKMMKEMENMELSTTSKYAIKKQISLAKAALLRERRSASEKGGYFQQDFMPRYYQEGEEDHHNVNKLHSSENNNYKTDQFQKTNSESYLMSENSSSRKYDNRKSNSAVVYTPPQKLQNDFNTYKTNFQEERIPLYNNEPYDNIINSSNTARQDSSNPYHIYNYHQIQRNRSNEKSSKTGAAAAPFANDYTYCEDED